MAEKINTTIFNHGTVIITENIAGEIYSINAEYFQDILNDWHRDCNFVPQNDARVFFASWNNEPINPYYYHDFESLLDYLMKKLKI